MNPTLLPAGNGVLATKSATCSSLSRIPVELSPKSVSFRCPGKTTLNCLLMSNNVIQHCIVSPVWDMSMLSGLMSLCTMPRLCKYCKARTMEAR